MAAGVGPWSGWLRFVAVLERFDHGATRGGPTVVRVIAVAADRGLGSCTVRCDSTVADADHGCKWYGAIGAAHQK